MLKASGVVEVDKSKGRIVLNLSDDFVRYYNWFITRAYWVKFNPPLHGSHITIGNKKWHSNINWDRAYQWDKEKLSFNYKEYIIRGGYTKGYIMFYLKVFSDEIDTMKKDVNIIESDDFRGSHATISNAKGSVKNYWPEMIELR